MVKGPAFLVSAKWIALVAFVSGICGCGIVKSAHTASRDYNQRKIPVDPPGKTGGTRFDQQVSGGELYTLHCGRCHNARPMGERSFAMNQVALAHMRNFAGLTGEEYRKLMHYFRRWHGVGPATPDVPPSPKRFFYEQPIEELQPDEA